MMIAITNVSNRNNLNVSQILVKHQLKKPASKQAWEQLHVNPKGSRVGAAKRLAVTNTNATFVEKTTQKETAQINLKFMNG